jgi:hypothetical protein
MEQMEETKKSGMFMPAVQYGVLTAIALIALTLFIYFAGLITAKWTSWISYGILLASIFIATTAYRNEHNGGFISYGTALGFGTMTIFFASVITAVFTYIFYKMLAPDALQQVKAAAEVQILKTNPNVTDQELDLAMRFVSPVLMSITTIFSYTFLGFVISLITSAVLKKKDPLEA